MPFGPLSDLAPRNEALQRAKAQEERRARSGPGFFGKLFGGADDPRLTGEQNTEARQAALRAGGFAGLTAAGQGRNVLSTAGAIGTAASDFREAHNEQLGEANLEMSQTLKTTTQLTELVIDGQKHRVIVDKETGRLIADLGASELVKSADLRAPIKVRLVNGDEVFAFVDVLNGRLLNASTGEVLHGAVPIPPKTALHTGKIMDRETGDMYEFSKDPFTGAEIPGTRRLVEVSEGAGDDLSLASTIDRHVDTMERALSKRGFRMFGVVPSWAVNVGILRKFTSSDLQIFNAAAQDVLSLVIRSRSGAQASEKEVARLNAFAIPLPGDHAETIRFKFQLMRDVSNDLRGGRDPYDRIRDPNSPDGLRSVPHKDGKMVAQSVDLGDFADLVK